MPDVVNIAHKFTLFSDAWAPRIIGEVNDMHVKAARIHGDFIWHAHEKEDEMFLVVKGTLKMRLRDGDKLVGPGEFIIIPRGVEHCPVSDEEVHVVLFEPKGTLNTGNVEDERTRKVLERV